MAASCILLTNAQSREIFLIKVFPNDDCNCKVYKSFCQHVLVALKLVLSICFRFGL